MRKPRARLTEKDKQEMLRRYVAGEDGRSISLSYGASPNYLYGLATQRGVKVGCKARCGGDNRLPTAARESYEESQQRRKIPFKPPKMAAGLTLARLMAGR